MSKQFCMVLNSQLGLKLQQPLKNNVTKCRIQGLIDALQEEMIFLTEVKLLKLIITSLNEV